MDTIDTQTWIIFGGVAVLVLGALAAWLVYRKSRTQALQARFGPEYNRTVDDLKSRTKAESNLREREKRVARFQIIALSPSDFTRFDLAWKTLQGGFIDNPKGALVQADQLVRELMLKRGYPMGDFEHRAADISVDHPTVVQNYRAAQAIALRDEAGAASTEELRKAVVHFRVLFNELLEARGGRLELTRPEPIEAHS
jgi:hypothetical protein